MKRQIKRMAMLLLVAATTLAVACGKDDDNNSPNPQPTRENRFVGADTVTFDIQDFRYNITEGLHMYYLRSDTTSLMAGFVCITTVDGHALTAGSHNIIPSVENFQTESDVEVVVWTPQIRGKMARGVVTHSVSGDIHTVTINGRLDNGDTIDAYYCGPMHNDKEVLGSGTVQFTSTCDTIDSYTGDLRINFAGAYNFDGDDFLIGNFLTHTDRWVVDYTLFGEFREGTFRIVPSEREYLEDGDISVSIYHGEIISPEFLAILMESGTVTITGTPDDCTWHIDATAAEGNLTVTYTGKTKIRVF